MLDLKFIRENPAVVRQALENRQDSAPLEEIIQLDAERRQKMRELDDLRQERKALSQERGKDKEKGRDFRVMIRDMEAEARHLDEQLEELLLRQGRKR